MKIKEALPASLLGVTLLLIWEVSCRLLRLPEYLLPSPSRIAREIWSNAASLIQNSAVTLAEALIGFAIANVLAIVAAILMVYIKYLDRAILPFAITLKTTPIIALAPLLLLWLGTGYAPKVAAAALISFFPALVNSIKGLNSLEEGEGELFRVYGASKTQLLLKLRLWRAAPYILAALKVSSSLAIVGAIVGEFIGANEGIGYVILVSSYHLETARMFAALSFAASAGVILYGILSYIDRKVVFWSFKSLDETGLPESPRSPKKRGVSAKPLAGFVVVACFIPSALYGAQSASTRPDVNAEHLLAMMNTWVMILGILVTILLSGSLLNFAIEFRRSKRSESRLREQEGKLNEHMTEFRERYNLASLKPPDAILREARNEARADYEPRIEAIGRTVERQVLDITERIKRLEAELKAANDKIYQMLVDERKARSGETTSSQ